MTATIFAIFTTSTKVAAFGHATADVISCVENVKIVSIVAVNTTLVLHLSQPGGLLAGRAVDGIYGGSDGHASDWLV